MFVLTLALLLWLLRGAAFCVAGFFLEDPPLKVHFLDVGQGLAVLWEYQGRFALWDTGPDSVGVIDTLKRYGVDSLEWIALSHWHRDHSGGFLELPAAMRSGSLVVKEVFFSNDTGFGFVSDSVFSIIETFRLKSGCYKRGDTLSFAPGFRFQILWPPNYFKSAGNSSSGVLYVKDSLSSMLLMSDLEAPQERELLVLSPTLRSNLLQVGHHGSANSSSIHFLSQVSPSEAVISVGKKNPYGHPALSTLNKFKFVLGDSSYLYRTDEQGTLIWLWHKNVGFWRE